MIEKNKSTIELKKDQPIQKPSEDVLSRSKIVDVCLKVLYDNSTKYCFSVGISGKWGIGKTSLMNLVKAEIISRNNQLKKKQKRQRINIITFNPWNFDNSNDLMTQFFTCLSSKINRLSAFKEKISDDESAETLKLVWLNLLPLFEKLPFIGKFISGVSGLIKRYKEILKKHNNSISAEKLKRKINKKLGKRKGRTVIFIDDIDRMNQDEIINIFHLVKLFADFDNTTYVLAYDKDIVVEALNGKQKAANNGERYLEKIIQFEFNLPRIKADDLNNVISNKLFPFLKPLNENQSTRAKLLIETRIFTVFTTIREVERFSNLFFFKKELLGNEVDMIDLLGLCWIEMFYKNVYLDIRGKSGFFIRGTEEPFVFDHNREQAVKNTITYMDNLVNSFPDSQTLKQVIFFLFPKVQKVYNKDTYYLGSIADNEFESQGRICSNAKFDVFFDYDLSKSELSISIINKIVGEQLSNEEVKSIINTVKIEQKTSQFLTHLDGKISSNGIKSNQNVIMSLQVILNNLEEFEKSESNYQYTDKTGYRIAKTLFDFCEKISNNESEIFLSSITNTYGKSRILTRYIGLRDAIDKKSILPINFLNENWFINLMKEYEVSIKEALSKYSIKNDAGRELFLSIRWADFEWLKEYVNTSIQNGHFLDILEYVISKNIGFSSINGKTVNYSIAPMYLEMIKDKQISEKYDYPILSDNDKFNLAIFDLQIADKTTTSDWMADPIAGVNITYEKIMEFISGKVNSSPQ